ncbi:growth arrest and DNA damage-inducible proteins-interacting protein 1 [Coccinella septempunctata]|uniref:growth arrest and DNA damage-inducible proteins-interacting protein 1 n=1 Tax=Coccinella septempunctata TaxID=41139 RepID=UPI001D0917E5|nr:growth arrest and DNA damage-inducible proteins-interacting protein 1 [Coccinella septempunctata]
MLRQECFKRSFAAVRIFNKYLSSNSSVNIEKLEQESATVDVFDEEAHLKEEQIQASRNKSRLYEAHRNIVLDQNPYPESKQWFHDTIVYKRKIFGRYGFNSGVDPAICWPTDKELEETLEYEKVAYPFTIPEMIRTAKEIRAAKDEATRKRQEDMLVKLSKLEGWKKDLEMRIAKKEAEANASRLKRERLIEEVRKHFGYKVDPKDDKFKELLEKKEKEQKKLAKEARKKEREAKLLEKLKTKKKGDKNDEEEKVPNASNEKKTDDEEKI